MTDSPRANSPLLLSFRPRAAAALANRLLGLDSLARLYGQRSPGLDAQAFLQYVLDVLGVDVEASGAANLAGLPARGALLVVANHPLGGLEGVAIARQLLGQRPDLKVLTNDLLCRVPELSGMFIGVDVLSGVHGRRNLAGLRRVHAHLRGGGALLVFPAGMVSAWEFDQRAIADRQWSRLVGQLVLRHRCPCLPIHVGGRNSLWFYLAGLLHPRLRTLLLPRQLLNKRGGRLLLSIGQPVPYGELANLGGAAAVTGYLRISTDALAPPTGAAGHAAQPALALAEIPADAVLRDAIGRLQDCRLLEHPEFDVYCAPHDRLGPLMDQIAVAREFTFRSVGEGTGLCKDTDRFDPFYLHLFLWDRRASRVAGAYRVGLVDSLVAAYGVQGLYTRSLYRYDGKFIDGLGHAMELGRSFIHPDYQRRPMALGLLWRGIGCLLARDPRYHTLFGSVSVSREYTDLARSLIADTMMSNYRAEEFTGLVRPTRPHRVRHRVWSQETLAALANIRILGKLVGRCDPGKAVPVLLRHYLALNGRLVCFNIHEGFNQSLEGLIVVDLRNCDSKTAIRFMGEAGYNRFLEFHRLRISA